MSRAIMTLLLLGLAPAAFAAPDLAAIAQNAPGLAEYPLADQITLYEHTEITVDADGRATRRVHQIRKILTNWAMRRVTDPRVGWDSSRQTLDVEVCRTRQAGGAIIDSPANALNEVTPDAVGRCAEFLDLREMVISHVGLEPGCVTELIYTITDLEPAPLPPSGRIDLQDRWPVLERRVTLTGKGLRSEILHGSGLTIETDGAAAVVRNAPGLPDEGNARRADHVPYLAYAYGVEDWTALAGHIAGAADPAAPALGDEMHTWLQSGDDLTVIDTVQRIAALVGADTRTVHLPGGMFSRTPRAAAEVFGSGCASRWEEALLAFTLLDALELKPALVLAGGLDTLPMQAPAVELWDRLLVSVVIDGQGWWVSPERGEAWTGPIAEASTRHLTVQGPHPGALLHQLLDGNTSAMKVSIAPDGSGLKLLIDWRANGLLRGHGTDADQLAESLVQAVLPGADVADTEVLKLDHHEVHLRVEAQADELGAFADGVLVLDLPQIPHGALTRLPHDCRLQEPVRHSPLFLPGGMDQALSVRIELPEGVGIDFLPAAFESRAGDSSYRFTREVADRTLKLDCRLKLYPGRIEPAQWPALREMLLAAQGANTRKLVLVEQ